MVPLIMVTGMSSGLANRVEGADRPLAKLRTGLKNAWPRKTLGGWWFWSDVFHNHGWRIQRHVMTGSCRLLDAKNVRHASGTEDDCRRRFLEIVPKAAREKHSPKTAIVVHGLGNWSVCMRDHAKELRQAGYTVVPFDYPSNFASIDDAAADLAGLIADLPPTDRIDLVGHSLGGLVLRATLARCKDERLGRVVLLGTPNQGADLARMLKKSFAFRATTGTAGQQLAAGGEYVANLPAPHCEFACIAGGRGERGYNPLLRGNDDGLVSVDSVRLDGAKAFTVVPANHHTLLHDEKVVKMTARFLETGSLD